MKRPSLFFLVVFLVAGVSPDMMGQTRKYNTKSGIITFETVMKIGKTEMRKKDVVYFDDYGTRECKESYMDGVLDEAFFSDGKDLYGLKVSQKAAFKRGKAFRGTEYRVDWNEIPAKDKKEGKAKQLPKMTVAGRECEAYEVMDRRGDRSVFAGWNHICLYTQINSRDLVTTTRAVKFEENASVPPEKFAVPQGFTLR